MSAIGSLGHGWGIDGMAGSRKYAVGSRQRAAGFRQRVYTKAGGLGPSKISGRFIAVFISSSAPYRGWERLVRDCYKAYYMLMFILKVRHEFQFPEVCDTILTSKIISTCGMTNFGSYCAFPPQLRWLPIRARGWSKMQVVAILLL